MSDNTRSIFLMLTAMASFAVNDTLMKLLMQSLNMSQAMVLRGIFASAALYLLARRDGADLLGQSRKDNRLISMRTLADIVATLSFFAALLHTPIANLTALMQFTPLAVTLAAAVFLGQPIGPRRLVAIGLGFVGVMIIIRPGSAGFNLWSLLGLVTVASVVVRDISTRNMSPGIPSALIALAASVAVTVTGLVGLSFEGWRPVGLLDLLRVLIATVCIVIAYLSVVAAMRCGDVAAVAPFRYSQLLWAILCGWVAFGEWPDAWAFVGAGLIVAGGVFTVLRNRARPT